MKSREKVELNERFNKRWLGYAAAASAAGIGMLGSAPAANASIIYTPSSVGVSPGFTVDGVTPLTFGGTSGTSILSQRRADGRIDIFYAWAGASLDASQGVVGRFGQPSELGRGAFIGSYQKGGFVGGQFLMRSVRGNFGYSGYSRNYIPGLGWHTYPINQRHGFAASQSKGFGLGTGYFGFYFFAADGVHYGWASVDLTETTTSSSVSLNVDVTGYAYNSVPGQSILAGQTATPEPGTLGLLAIGSLGLGFWRRRAVMSDK